MPKRDFFADKRKTVNGIKPKQAAVQKKKKVDRCYKRRYKAERDLKVAEVELSAKEKEVAQITAVRDQLMELMAKAPSPAEQRKIIMATFMEAKFNPIEVMIDMVQDGNADLTDKDRANIVDKLASYFAPKPKTIDLQADMKSSVNINVVDYSKMTQKDLIAQTQDESNKLVDDAKIIDIVSDEDYSEFESPEDQVAQQ